MSRPERKRPAGCGRQGVEESKHERPSSLAKFSTTADAKTAFVDAICAAGITPADPREIVADGEIHRFRIEGDAKGRKNGWAVLHLDGAPAGAFGSWKHGASGTWRASRAHTLTNADRRRILEAKTQREAEQEQQQREAAERAARIWRDSRPADPQHPYLVRKRIRPCSARQRGDRLVLRLVDFNRATRSLQFIGPDGDKTLLRAGRKSGCCIPVAGRMPGASRVLVAEGFATAATLADAEPDALVLAAVDAGNLEPVALSARREWPDCEIVICADADEVGQTKGRQAARAADALLAVPEFPPGISGSDFNDLAGAA